MSADPFTLLLEHLAERGDHTGGPDCRRCGRACLFVGRPRARRWRYGLAVALVLLVAVAVVALAGGA